jgi:hypothetical protein
MKPSGWSTTARAFREHVLRIPNRLVPQLAGVKDAHCVYDILSFAMREALTEFGDHCDPAR